MKISKTQNSANIFSLRKSAIADEFAIGCGKPQYTRYRCNMAARYQEYAIHLNAIIDGDMSMEMFNEAVIFIDREIEQRLYSENGK